MALATSRISITGRRPLLWNAFGVDSLPLEKRARTGVAGNDPQEWQRSVRATKTRQLYLEPMSVFGCIRSAAKYTTQGRGTLQPKVAATLEILDDIILIDRWLPKKLDDLTTSKDDGVYLDVRSVVNPMTKGRNIRYRVAAAPGWKTDFRIAWEETLISEHQMRSVLNDAGQFVELGDGRAIGFGRFLTTRFELETDAKKQVTRRGVGSKATADMEA